MTPKLITFVLQEARLKTEKKQKLVTKQRNLIK